MKRNGWLVLGIFSFCSMGLIWGCKEGAKAPGTSEMVAEPVRCEAEVKPETLAFIGKEPVTMKDLNQADVDMALKQQAFEAQENYLQGREALLADFIFQMLVEKEAKAKGISSEELVKKEVENKIAKVSESEVKAYYDQIAGERKKAKRSTPPLDKVAPQVRAHLENEAMTTQKEKYFASLRKKYDVKYVETDSGLSKPRYKVAIGDLPLKGDAKAPITIVEFSEFECPYCGRGTKTVADVLKAYKGLVKLHFRDFPLDFHKNAKLAGIAGHCAASQEKFWELHDKMFDNRTKLQRKDLVGYAKGLGLDMPAFEKCLDDPAMAKKVEDNMDAGKKLGIRGVPAFFINGVKLGGAVPFEEFEKVIDEELKALGIEKPKKKVMP